MEKERREEAALLDEIRRLLPQEPWQAADWALFEGLAAQFPAMLYSAWKGGEIEDLGFAIWAAWVRNRSPASCLEEEKWLELFNARGFFVMVAETVGTPPKYEHQTERPTNPLKIWRGAPTPSGGRGMSWSAYQEAARTFAIRWSQLGKEAAVFEAVVPPEGVLALFGDANEQEVVVDREYLEGRIRLVESIPAEDLLSKWPPRPESH